MAMAAWRPPPLVPAAGGSYRASTITARSVTVLGVDALLLAADAGIVDGHAVRSCYDWRKRYEVEPDDDAYVPDEDDRGSWLASMTCLDRAVERGMAGVASLILDGTDAGDLPQVSERARLLVAEHGWEDSLLPEITPTFSPTPVPSPVPSPAPSP